MKRLCLLIVLLFASNAYAKIISSNKITWTWEVPESVQVEYLTLNPYAGSYLAVAYPNGDFDEGSDSGSPVVFTDASSYAHSSAPVDSSITSYTEITSESNGIGNKVVEADATGGFNTKLSVSGQGEITFMGSYSLKTDVMPTEGEVASTWTQAMLIYWSPQMSEDLVCSGSHYYGFVNGVCDIITVDFNSTGSEFGTIQVSIPVEGEDTINVGGYLYTSLQTDYNGPYPTTVPEPSILLLLGTVFCFIAGRKRLGS